MLNVFRSQKKQTDYDEGSDLRHANTNQYSDLGEILDEAVKKLPPEQKTIILLRDYEGYSYKEIGEMLRLSESQVKVYIFRARKFLQQYLKSVETVI